MHVACWLQCQTDLLFNLDTWSQQAWQYQDGTSVPAAATLHRIHDIMHHREGQVHWKVGAVEGHSTRVNDLLDVLRVGLRLIKPPDPPPPRMGHRVRS